MNDKKFCFITCVNNSMYYEESVRYINFLEVPPGYEVECIRIDDATSITSGYNTAIRRSDAKYKIYLHQDVFIINKNFMIDILRIFEENPNLGLMGVVGAKKLPPSGIWWEADKLYGKVFDNHTGQMEPLDFRGVNGLYEKVQAIDGLIMITQYDIPWREEVFKGWHFYDVSQSLEFILAGYEVGVMKQDKPWCIHDCGVVNTSNYEETRKLFTEYYREFFN